jgi:short subunit fatty acids transporter
MNVSLLLAVLTGLGLAAACGFRIFVPLLIASIAARTELLMVHEDFAWLAGTPALVAFALATALEIGGYYGPVVDNLLDTIATPAAALAGALLACAVLVDVEPWLRWSLGIIAGASVATAVQVPTAAVRGGSTLTTAGTANFGVASGEAVGASVVSGVAIFVPIAIPMVLIALIVAVWRLRRRRTRPSI